MESSKVDNIVEAEEVHEDPFYFSKDRLVELFDNYHPPQVIIDSIVFHDKGLWPEMKMEKFVREHNAMNRNEDGTPMNNYQQRNNYVRRDGQPQYNQNRQSKYPQKMPWQKDREDRFQSDSIEQQQRILQAPPPPPKVTLTMNSFSEEQRERLRQVKIWVYLDQEHKMQGPFDTRKMDEWHSKRYLPGTLPLAVFKNNEAPSASSYEQLRSVFESREPFKDLPEDLIIYLCECADISVPNTQEKKISTAPWAQYKPNISSVENPNFPSVDNNQKSFQQQKNKNPWNLNDRN